MSNYDDYITGSDKPFAENINDALLLSNVFDLTVPIQVPTMFNDGTWIDTVGSRKCGVAIVTLKEQLPSGVSISTVDGKSVLTGTGTVKLGFYPNFNSFGKIKSISWENTGTVQINLKTVNNTTILSDIPKGIIQNSTTELRKLQEIVIEIVLNNSTLKTLDVVMENKQQNRYGATVGISDVTGLDERISEKVNIIDIKDNLTSTDIDKPLSANQGKVLKELVDTKSDNTHNHDDRYIRSADQWVHITNENKGDEWYYADIYVNMAMRLVDFHYYRINYYFSNTTSINIVDNVRFIVGVRNQSVDITPKMNTPLASFNATIVGGLARSNQTNPSDPVYTSLTVQSTSTGSKNINIRGMWHF